MEIAKETRTYKLTGTTSILGSCPANPEVYSQYISKKSKDIQKTIAEEEMLPELDELKAELEGLSEKGLTVFLRNGRGKLCLSNHVVKGYFKGAATALKDQMGLTMAKSKIDNLVFVEPTFLPFMRGDEAVGEPDGVRERPLRAMTMQGERVALAASEEIEEGWQLTVSVTLVQNAGRGKSDALTFEKLEGMLDYGALKGLGQWRNGGYGCFTWERVG